MCHQTFRYFKGFLTVLALLTITTIVSADEYLFPNLAGDANAINFQDFTVLAENWQQTGSALAGDFDNSGQVDFNDLKILCDYWLAGTQSPEDVFEAFKTALVAGDVNEAVSFFTIDQSQKYRILFQQLQAYLPQMAGEMGELILVEQDENIAYYDLMRQENTETYGYPVLFVKDETGNWKISGF